jgi:hypothetical protein
MFQSRPFASAFPPPVYPPVGDCFASWDSYARRFGLFTHAYSIGSETAAVMHPLLFAQRDRSTALRSGRLMLFRPSSLQGRSDFPYTRNALLAGITNLKHAYLRWITEETRGSQARSPVICPCMPLTLPRVPCWCKCPLLPNKQWPSP